MNMLTVALVSTNHMDKLKHNNNIDVVLDRLQQIGKQESGLTRPATPLLEDKDTVGHDSVTVENASPTIDSKAPPAMIENIMTKQVGGHMHSCFKNASACEARGSLEESKQKQIPDRPIHMPPMPPTDYDQIKEAMANDQLLESAVTRLSPAEELRMKILTLACDSESIVDDDKFDLDSDDAQEGILEYFSRIYGFSPNFLDEDSDNLTLPGVDFDEQEFVGPFHGPGYLGISSKQVAEGLTVTISAVETLDTFYMYDHSSSGQLMVLETEMNKWYGHYLWRKVSERMGIYFNIVAGGYYAVYLENLKIWARCFVDEVLSNSYSSHCFSPSQRVRAVLFDYEGRLRTFERKQFLPLTRAFLAIPVQKTIGKLDANQEEVFPWNTKDINIIRQKLEGNQFRVFTSNYDILTEPFAVMTVRLCEIRDTKTDKKQWRRLCDQMDHLKLLNHSGG